MDAQAHEETMAGSEDNRLFNEKVVSLEKRFEEKIVHNKFRLHFKAKWRKSATRNVQRPSRLFVNSVSARTTSWNQFDSKTWKTGGTERSAHIRSNDVKDNIDSTNGLAVLRFFAPTAHFPKQTKWRSVKIIQQLFARIRRPLSANAVAVFLFSFGKH